MTAANQLDPKSSSLWTTTLMTHYQLMGTRQVCKCGAVRKGSIASEVFVHCERGSAGTGGASIPIRELKRRYMRIFNCGEKAVHKYLPQLPLKIVWADVEVEQCPACFKGMSAEQEKAYRLPPVLPMNIPDTPGWQANAAAASVRAKRDKKASLSIHLGKGSRNAKGPDAAKANMKPIALGDLLPGAATAEGN